MIIKLLLGNRTEKSKNLNYKLQRIRFLRKTDLPSANDFIKNILVQSSINDGRNNLFLTNWWGSFADIAYWRRRYIKHFVPAEARSRSICQYHFIYLKSRNFQEQEWKPFCKSKRRLLFFLLSLKMAATFMVSLYGDNDYLPFLFLLVFPFSCAACWGFANFS